MRFIDIVKPKNAVEVEEFLAPYVNGEKEFSPEVAMEVLKSTNFEPCIAKLLDIIEGLSGDAQAEYKDIVLSVVCRREQPSSIAVKAMALAVKSGYDEELNKLKNVDAKEYLASQSTNTFRAHAS